jgi:signal transduction histidine kinase/DNA-binding response OmpR family regulator
MSKALLKVAIQFEQDVVIARQRARHIASLLGFEPQEQTRIATAVSEIVRNAFRYATGGRAEFLVEGESSPQLLIVRVTDKGMGIPNLPEILSGQYRSSTGMGLGIIGAQRLMDQVQIRSLPNQGTEVVLKKIFPARVPVLTNARIAQIAQDLASRPPSSIAEELQQQNQELLRTLGELRERQEELMVLNRELEDTNRGVVALYAELDEKADHLRRADEMKSRFLSNMSHEFRTPLNSIRALGRLLVDRSDGELTDEQEKQVNFILKSANELTELVDDLLDLAKIEAGKTEVRPVEFSVANLFSALRGMLRPLLVSDMVQLVFDNVPPSLLLYSDEGKISQILRNFISNAIKFTERGEVRVSAVESEDGKSVSFSVTDTGVGIKSEDQALIFEEFAQVANKLQGRVKGTGLGLPLCRRLARLLQGEIALSSQVGVGSTFTAMVPKHFDEGPDVVGEPDKVQRDLGLIPVLIVDDDAETRLLYEKFLRGTRFQPVSARNLREARELTARVHPRAIVLDILLRGEDSWRWLGEIKRDPETSHIRVLVATSVDDERKGLALGADAYSLKPIERPALLEKLEALTGPHVLVIDDDPASRYLLQKLLADERACVIEAADGRSGLVSARRSKPSLIFLDLQLPDSSGEDVLRELKNDSTLKDVPVAIVTAKLLNLAERERLSSRAQAVLQKSELSADTTRVLLAASGF